MSGKKILLSPSAYYPSLGGVEEICRNLATVLKENGHTVSIAVNRHPENLPKLEVDQQIEINRFKFLTPSRNVKGLLSLLLIPGQVIHFLVFVQRYNPDIIHVICPSSNSLYCFAAKLALRKKLVVTLQGEFFMDANDIYGRSGFARYCAARLLSVADTVTACSKFVLDDAKARFKFNARTEEVIFNGVDLAEKAEPQISKELPEKFILGIGRLVPNKGFDDLILAFEKLAPLFDDVHLVLAGAGASLQDLQELANKVNLKHRIHFVGRQDRSEVSFLFDKCLFFVLPSHVEPFGIVCLEAMRAGKPVVASDIGGPPEFIEHEKTGLLFEPRNITSLFSALKRLAEDERLRQDLGKCAEDKVASFSWNIIGDEYCELYRQS